MIVTPQGKLAQYFYGIDFAPKDLRLGIGRGLEREDWKSGGPGVAVLLSLRSRDRKVWRDCGAGAEAVRSRNDAGTGADDFCAGADWSDEPGQGHEL